MKIAIVGCSHGELDNIYAAVQHLDQTEKLNIQLLICCGDFQSIRNHGDLNCMAVPPKYRELKDFYKYYSGERRAPYLTIFVGGNHEASNYLAELPYGGWVAERIYYLGYANVVSFGGLRIGSISGIFKGHDYHKGHFECPPYNNDTQRSAYHIRETEVFRLKQLKGRPLDIFISHDWPRNINRYGNEEQLLRFKRHFADEIEAGELGNPTTEMLLSVLRPEYYFCAHMHVKFPAIVTHDDGRTTRFLALDKCLPGRRYLQVLDIPNDPNEPCELRYDPEWLAVLKSTDTLSSISNRDQFMPGPTPGMTQRFDFTPSVEELEAVKDLFANDYRIPENFRHTAPPLSSDSASSQFNQTQTRYYVNPQTTEFCGKLGITNLNELLAKLARFNVVDQPCYLGQCASTLGASSTEVSTSASCQNFVPDSGDAAVAVIEDAAIVGSGNPDEIRLEDDEETPDDMAEMQAIETAIRKRQLEDLASDSVTTETNSNNGSDDVSTVMKPLKRRNAAIYGATNDDQE